MYLTVCLVILFFTRSNINSPSSYSPLSNMNKIHSHGGLSKPSVNQMMGQQPQQHANSSMSHMGECLISLNWDSHQSRLFPQVCVFMKHLCCLVFFCYSNFPCFLPLSQVQTCSITATCRLTAK